MKTKRFLSIVLSMILILNFVNTTRRYANAIDFNEEETLVDCPKNFKDGHESISCARIAAKNVLKKREKDYLVMKDVGSLANEEIYYFTFRALDKILDELGLDPDEDKLREEWQNLEKERVSYFSVLKNTLRIGIGSLIGALGGNELYSLARSERKKHHKDRIKFLRRPVRTISKLGVVAMMLIGSAFIGSITSIWLKIKHDIAEKKEYEIFDKEYKIYKLNSKKAVPLNRMLKYIKDSNYLLDAETLFYVHAMPKEVWMFSPGTLEGLNYTEEEKASFPERLKKLAQDIEKNLGRRLEK